MVDALDLCFLVESENQSNFLKLLGTELPGINLYFINLCNKHNINLDLMRKQWSGGTFNIRYLHDIKNFFDSQSTKINIVDIQYYILNQCGNEPWFFIITTASVSLDVINYCRNLMDNNKVAQIGRYDLGMVGYRREAIKQTGVDFRSLNNIYAIKEKDGRIRLRHVGDSRCCDKSMPISWDNNVILELYFRWLRWLVIE